MNNKKIIWIIEIFLLLVGMMLLTVAASSAAECDENGCGPGGWKVYYLGFVVEPQLIGPYTLLLSEIFDGSCNYHDQCYCRGYTTYCDDRDQCDYNLLNDMINDCISTFCVSKDCVPWCCEPITYSHCVLGATAFYDAVHLFGEGRCRKISDQETCYDYRGLGGQWTCPAENPTTVYVDKNAWCPEHGTEGKPVSTVERGRDLVGNGGTLIIAAGSYPETPVISKSMTLQASGGTVVIG